MTGGVDDRPGLTDTTKPTLLERGRHVFGVHTWRSLDDGRLRCPGCGRERLTFETATAQGSSTFDAESTPGAWPAGNDTPGHDEDYGAGDAWPREERGEPRRPGSQEPTSAWEWFQGMRWWVRLWLAFILLQVILFVASIFTGGGGGG